MKSSEFIKLVKKMAGISSDRAKEAMRSMRKTGSKFQYPIMEQKSSERELKKSLEKKWD